MQSLTSLQEATHQVYDEGFVWTLLKRGDEKALLQFYDLCYDQLYSYGLYICKDTSLVEDCIQDTFLEIWERRHHLPEVRFVKAYLLKIVKYKLLKLIAFHSRNLPNDEALNERVDKSMEDIIVSEEHRSAVSLSLQNALEKLTRRQKEVIMLKFFNDFTYDEIVAFTGLSQQRIYNLVHDAVRQLRSNLFRSVNFNFKV